MSTSSFSPAQGYRLRAAFPLIGDAAGVWSQYRWEEYACQDAFDDNPEKVLKFHELRCAAVLACKPHAGHAAITTLEKKHPRVTVVTQNIDGIHQRSGSGNVIEPHGSLWRLRCPYDGISEDFSEKYKTTIVKNAGAG